MTVYLASTARLPSMVDNELIEQRFIVVRYSVQQRRKERVGGVESDM
jgi:hypothetical protein